MQSSPASADGKVRNVLNRLFLAICHRAPEAGTHEVLRTILTERRRFGLDSATATLLVFEFEKAVAAS